MEPDRQVEIQLGHMCNNRCVFCVSGQRTAMREAFPIAAAPVLEKLREAREQGIEKVTLLGGEPTLQPDFLDVVRGAVALGFREIVVFTNGVKTARDAFLDEVLATGGDFTWRLSFQGATMLSHERTTKKLGSFGRLKETLKNLHRRGQRVTVNMCVVRSNYESVAAFPELLLPFGVRQVHLDMMRPLDAGVRTEDELRDTIPRYSDLAAPFTAMIEGFEARSPGFDVNVGNLPYCVAPRLAPWIHHQGETTFTVSVNQRYTLSEAKNKYRVQSRDKVKPASCAECVFNERCSGVFETYERFYGLDELVPVTHAQLATLDPAQRLFDLHVRPFVAHLEGWTPPAPFARFTTFTNARDAEVRLRFSGPEEGAGDAFALVALRRGGAGAGGVAAADRFSLHLIDAHGAADAVALLRALFARLCEAAPVAVLHPVADDAALRSERALATNIDRRIGQCLGRLRARAPFGELAWRDARVEPGGREASVTLDARDGNTVTVSLAVKGASVAGGYRLGRPVEAPSPSLVASVRSVMDALRSP